MKRLLLACALTGCMLGSSHRPAAPGADPKSDAAPAAADPKSGGALAPADSGFAVIELFTSEGCNTCPPADKLLATFDAEYPGKVFAMGFHVDYWNRLGWKDRFSSSEYTERQSDYVRRMHLQSAYTPQAVVNGTEETVGSEKDKLEGFIHSALQTSNKYFIEVTATAKGPGHWGVHYHTNIPSPNGEKTDDLHLSSNQLNLALVQKSAQSSVTAGENNGNTLSHVNVVRAFDTEYITRSGDGEISVKGPKDLQPGDCRLFLYAQDPFSGQILKAVEVGMP